MILIALSKKSHTYWRLIDNHDKIHQYQTLSLNSLFHSKSFEKAEKNELPPIDMDKVSKLYFYSSECKGKDSCGEITGFLSRYFKHAAIHIDDDMLATAQALCGHGRGIAVILGSSVQSCLYDGELIEARTHTTLEEGSGAYLGKQLVTAYLDKTLPDGLVKLFISKYKPAGEDFETLINKEILKEKEFLASLSPFLFRNITHPFIAEMVYKAFSILFDKYIIVYPDFKKLKIHFAGAVAFYYGNILREVANDKEANISTVVENPIAGLSLYHQSE